MKRKLKEKKNPHELLDDMDRQIKAVTGGRPTKKLDPAAQKRQDKMKRDFEKIDAKNLHT